MPFELPATLRPDYASYLHVATEQMDRPEERSMLGLILLCYFAGWRDKPAVNHTLLEGLNGVAKTTAVKAVTRAINGAGLEIFHSLTDRSLFTRIQGGPEVAPSDCTGFDVLKGGELQFSPGPFLTTKPVHYFDELNRSPARTQSCVLEPMAENGAVTVLSNDDRWRHRRTVHLGGFFLMASQNPSHQEGTFPLPEAGLDRFLCKLTVPMTSRLADLVHHGEPCGRARPQAFDLAAILASETFNETVKLLQDKQRRKSPTLESYLKWIWKEARLPAIPEVSQLGGPAAIAERVAQLDPANGDDVAFADRVEILLTAVRHQELDTLRLAVRDLPSDPSVPEFIADLVYNTWSESAYREAVGGLSRSEPIPIPLRRDKTLETARAAVRQGASPRAAFALRDLAQAYACCAGAEQVTCADVRRIAGPVLRHRILLRFEAAAQGQTEDDIVSAITTYLMQGRGEGGAS